MDCFNALYCGGLASSQFSSHRIVPLGPSSSHHSSQTSKHDSILVRNSRSGSCGFELHSYRRARFRPLPLSTLAKMVSTFDSYPQK